MLRCNARLLYPFFQLSEFLVRVINEDLEARGINVSLHCLSVVSIYMLFILKYIYNIYID